MNSEDGCPTRSPGEVMGDVAIVRRVGGDNWCRAVVVVSQWWESGISKRGVEYRVSSGKERDGSAGVCNVDDVEVVAWWVRRTGGYEQNQCRRLDASWSGNEGWLCWVRMANGSSGAQTSQDHPGHSTSQAGVLTAIPRAEPWKSAPTKQSRLTASIFLQDMTSPAAPYCIRDVAAVGSLVYCMHRAVPHTMRASRAT